MRRPQLEHVIRAAAGITGAPEIVVIGSQAVLGQFPDAPDELLLSVEADVFTFRDPADAELIEGSPFHQTFGYYAHGVAEETAVLPTGWKERLGDDPQRKHRHRMRLVSGSSRPGGRKTRGGPGQRFFVRRRLVAAQTCRGVTHTITASSITFVRRAIGTGLGPAQTARANLKPIFAATVLFPVRFSLWRLLFCRELQD